MQVHQLEVRLQELNRAALSNNSNNNTVTSPSGRGRDISSSSKNASAQDSQQQSLELVVEELRRANRELERQLTEWRTRTDGVFRFSVCLLSDLFFLSSRCHSFSDVSHFLFCLFFFHRVGE